MARGRGRDCDQVKSSPIQSGSSNSGGAPWLTNRAGSGPSAGVHSRWPPLDGATSCMKASKAAPGSRASIGESIATLASGLGPDAVNCAPVVASTTKCYHFQLNFEPPHYEHGRSVGVAQGVFCRESRRVDGGVRPADPPVAARPEQRSAAHRLADRSRPVDPAGLATSGVVRRLRGGNRIPGALLVETRLVADTQSRDRTGR